MWFLMNNINLHPIDWDFIAPAGFWPRGPEAKTRGGTLGVPRCIHTGTKNICWKSKKCVCRGRSVLDLTKLGAHGHLGNILASAHSGVGYLQPRGRVSSPWSSSSILQHLKVLHLRVRVCFVIFELHHLQVTLITVLTTLITVLTTLITVLTMLITVPTTLITVLTTLITILTMLITVLTTLTTLTTVLAALITVLTRVAN